ncbi:hypothetical protein TSAR_016336 [Trichomalopsis sarcophagae]|uniref:Uncharacterized protein n=1 Tax=Trichomalopsis sarcophagae TaxID=543379 RepID=A0A232EWL7_9HYME|nr:hypothetical protein TSAR_016336 [Trichomalopsis sarcophagae]
MDLRVSQTHKVVEKNQREDLKILKELGNIEEKATFFLKVPELRLGGESLGSRTISRENLASMVSARSMDSTSSITRIADYRKAQQEAIEVRKEEKDYITKLEKKVGELIEDCQSAPKDVKRTAERAKQLKVLSIQSRKKHEKGNNKDARYEGDVDYYQM